MLNVEKKTENGALFLTLEGELDTLTSPELEAEMLPLLADAASVVLDFEKLSYISSAGLRVLLTAEQVMEEKGAERVRIVKMNDTIRNIFELTGFDNILALD